MGDLTIKQKLAKLIQNGISFEVSGDKLLVRGELKKLLTEDKIFLKENKVAIISLIETRAEQTTKIARASEDAIIPLSFSQQSLWLLDRINDGSNSYNLFSAFKLKGALDYKALNKTFSSILERHAILRTNFVINETGDPIQKIQSLETFKIPLDNLTTTSKNIEIEVDNYIRAERDYIFDLANDLLLRAQLLKTDKSEHVLLVNMHHIVSDGWSIGILLKELNVFYTNYITGEENIELPKLPIQYADYSLWQRKWLSGKVWDQHVEYWKNQLQDIPVVHNLSMDKPRPIEQTFNGKTIVSHIGKASLEGLYNICKSEQASLFMGMHAVFSAFLARYSNEKCIVVGSPVANRERKETKDLVGFFMNLLVLKSDLSENPGFQELVRQSKKVLEGAYEHQQFPFEKVVEQLKVDRNLSHNPLFQILLTLQNKEQGAVDMQGIELEPIGNQTNTAKYDLSLNIQEATDELILLWEFNTDLFNESTIANMANHFEVFVNAILETPNKNIFEINMVNADELADTCKKLQGKNVDISGTLGAYDSLENQVLNHPDEIAIICNDIKYNYGELGNRISEITYLLQEKGVQSGDHVGISLLRNMDMIASIFACFKLGAVYVPLDPVYSSEKIDQIIEEVNPKCLITLQSLQDLFLKETNEKRLLLLDHVVETNSAEITKEAYDGNNIAYIIFTSGTTGKPKGIEITHKSLDNFLVGLDATFSNAARQKWLAQTSINFDISILELVWTISRGHSVVLQQTNPYKLIPENISDGDKKLDFSVMFFGADKKTESKYDLLLNTAKYSDENGFSAIWTPERHFGEFGGAFASPAVIGSALAVSTKNINIRSGSVVLPLHDPIRVAEEWSIIDNLSHGRVGMSIASGWQPDDFVFFNSDYKGRHQDMRDRIKELRNLWKGTPVVRKNGIGNDFEIKIRPKPIQKELPLWITAAGSPATFKYAGEIGANLLTHMLGQTLESLSNNIAIYQQALTDNGFKVEDKTVSLMLHTYIDESNKKAAQISEQPFKEYLGTSIKLMEPLAKELDLDVHSQLDVLIDAAYQKFSKENTLIGSPESCQKMLSSVKKIGVTEIACLVDFGVEDDLVLRSLERIVEAKKIFNAKVDLSAQLNLDNQKTELDLIDEYAITHVQMTPSLSRLVLNLHNQSKGKHLSSITHWLIGGEAISKDLIKGLTSTTKSTFFNMYGPTETTIWSAWREITQNDVRIGNPMFNTDLILLNEYEQPVPLGTVGELYIGGLGLAKGYYNNPELTAEKFKNIEIPNIGTQRYYKTGDLMKLTTSGKLEYIGRKDDQVKINGYRIEIEEVEGTIAMVPGVKSCKVIHNKTGETSHLSAYIVQEEIVHGDYKELPLEKQARPFKFPDGSTVYHQSDRQLGMLYDEIIKNGIYFRHNISIPENGLVLDVGANIGTFSIDISEKHPDATVIAFEPIPEIFSALKKNFEYRNIKGKVFNYGISDKNEEAVFNYYPQMAGMSGRFADKETILESIDQYIQHDRNMLEKEPESASSETKEIVQSLYKEFQNSSDTSAEYREYLSSLYETEKVTCKLTTVSDILDELDIQTVDLLKLDVEKSECLVLDGIREEHWNRIRQLAVEVDGDNNLEIIKDLLFSKGYTVNVEELVMGNIEVAAEENTYMLYATNLNFGQEENTSLQNLWTQLDEKIMNDSLRKKLPDYMIPKEISFVPSIPLMENGKVDRIKLKQFKAETKIQPKKGKVQLTSPTEQKIYRVWSEVLKKENIDPSVSIFEAGGNSIEIVLLHERLQTEFNVTFSLIELFRNPTILQQVSLVKNTDIPKDDVTVKKAMNKGKSRREARLKKNSR
ncbi:Linear gramicidin synthase subunit D [Kordia antarctica]|uniref:Linear gramicidin synthase subunit D n=1 Tax=Kordia antarctica TaxID=1218801 RepID=A0A7L4ZFR3_9FLAO|nr:MupA/Atu3671 family FMN-dependent luciferase-like monooxygenase [Kordia antarctica]QHI35455.1 Linear gramicidin synthase subunit D [Kordia antarctica]